MLNFILLAVAIYLALIAASLTILMVTCSDWFTKKCMKMGKKITEEIMSDDMF